MAAQWPRVSTAQQQEGTHPCRLIISCYRHAAVLVARQGVTATAATALLAATIGECRSVCHRKCEYQACAFNNCGGTNSEHRGGKVAKTAIPCSDRLRQSPWGIYKRFWIAAYDMWHVAPQRGHAGARGQAGKRVRAVLACLPLLPWPWLTAVYPLLQNHRSD